MSISRIVEWCKSPEVLITVVIVLVGFGSFGLGRLSRLKEAQAPVDITYPAAMLQKGSETSGNTAVAEAPPFGPPRVVGSRTGRKYHFPWCPGAEKMTPENRVWFVSIEEARAAGYLPAANCKGLR